ncbi:MAG: BatA domain-containing protein [Pelobium sp.]
MSFLYPIGLLALAGIVIPLIIHLWNVKEGKTLKIGSIAFLGESSSQSSKSLKIKDWFLLLLRCLIVMIIAFLIAGPYIQKKLIRNGQAGWILVEPQNLNSVYQQHKKSIDSLLKNGFELHQLALEFPLLKLSDTSNLADNKRKKLPLSSLIKQLNNQLPPNFKTIVYGDLKQSSFIGALPAISLDLEFHQLNNKDSVLQKAISAYWSVNDSLKVLVMNSSSDATNYQLENFTPKNSHLEMKTEDGESFVKTKTQNDWIKVNNKPLEVAIYSDYRTDANYLNAALRAIRSFTKRKINIKTVANSSSISSNEDWVFWLSEKSIPLHLTKKSSIFLYQKGKMQPMQTSLILGTAFKPKLYQRVKSDSIDLEKIWTDGFGNSILGFEQKNEVNIYHFYSRLDPQWSDFVWSESFAKALMPILFAKPNHLKEFGFYPDNEDERRIASSENLLKVNKKGSSGKIKKQATIQQSIADWFWFIGLVLFLIERLVTYKQQKNLQYGR